MSGTELALHAVVAVAATLQGITGIGFALLAGPALLILRGDAASLQVVALLTLAIALVLMPLVWRAVSRPVLLAVTGAAVSAMPLGLALYAVASVAALKLGAGALLAALLIAMRLAGPGRVGPGRGPALVAGGIAGVTGGALAMIGPPISLYLTASGARKDTARATVLAAFIPCYLVLIGGQAATAGFSRATLLDAAAFLPALIAGTLAGHLAAARVDERRFRRVVRGFLAATAAALVLDGSGLAPWGRG